jgi:hypothetical protein
VTDETQPTPAAKPPVNPAGVANSAMVLSLKREIDRLSKLKLSPHGVVAMKVIRKQYGALESVIDQDAAVSLAIMMQTMLLRAAKYDLGLYPNSAAQKIAMSQPPMVEELDSFEKYLAIIKRYC